MEIEIRARVENLSEIRDILGVKGKPVGFSSEDDLYLRHESDIERSLVLRIRRMKDGSLLTFKGKAKGDDTAWPDVDLPLFHPDDLEKLLLGSGYVEVVRIQKCRSTYCTDEFEINLDKIERLGNFIEIEGRGTDESRSVIEQDMTRLLIELGIQESAIIRKGYVALMLDKLSSEPAHE